MKKLIGPLFVALVAVAGIQYFSQPTAVADSAHRIAWPDNTVLTQQQKTHVAQVFFSLCPDLNQRLSGARARIETGPYREATYGWRQFIRIDVQLEQHTLHYSLGGGDRPGIEGMKPIGANACSGQRVPAGSNWFVPSRDAAFVDSL